ncbi:uncharacterized protein [Typha latifolia]|uniref:uncharacterized protein n=1 Tax=Typha latifolia TaxID=4733 RepID=UPI003C2CD58D
MEACTTGKKKKKATVSKKSATNCYYCCFFCSAKEPNAQLRRAALSAFFRDMPCRDDDESGVLVLSSIWHAAMTDPDDPELPSVGVLRCMSLLLSKSLADPAFLRRRQNAYIPYYAAHILGSYTIRCPSLAALAVESGAVPPLVGVLRAGAMTWVEQRVAVRALGHIASYDATFPAVARHAKEVVPLAMGVATSCIGVVYSEFVILPPARRERYHSELLTRGLGGVEMEDKKAEEWASQLQCWSLYLLSCFACRDFSYHQLICQDLHFLKDLCHMWGGLANGDSPAGVGLMRLLCRSSIGRDAVAGCREVVQSLCNLTRSSDDWQYMGVDCLLLLLEDSGTRRRVIDLAAPCLVDLAELHRLGSRENLGEAITSALLVNLDDVVVELSLEAKKAIKSLWDLKVERKQREETMSTEESTKKESLARAKKQQGNKKFSLGDVEGATLSYTEALEICPLNQRKQRVVLYSNRAQCRLLLRQPDAAIGDATRALALASPANRHAKSLWRRSQAYDMKGMAKESLMDCLVFVKLRWLNEGEEERQEKVPYYVVRMINKQMSAVGIFAIATLREPNVEEEEMNIGLLPTSVSGLGLPTIVEEPTLRSIRVGGRRRLT